MDFITTDEPVKISDITSALDQYKSYTLKKDVAYLTNEGLIQKIGKARATIYVVAGKKIKDSD